MKNAFAALAFVATAVSAQESPNTVFKVLQAPNGDQVLFQNGQFNCPKDQRRAILLNPSQSKVFTGCWQMVDDYIYVVWDDGDPGKIPSRVVFGDKKES